MGHNRLGVLVAPGNVAWAEYERWNETLADVLFPVLEHPLPVYINLEAEVIDAIGARMGLPAGEVVASLAHAVAETVDLTGTSSFRWHRERLMAWRTGGRVSTSPLIALLCVFGLAAERMASGGGMAASNYYGRLAELLGGKPDQLGESYRKVAEPFWSGLNLWLTTLGGQRGLPTAYSAGLRYVGLAISQALVREADRRRFEKFFSDFGLPPRSDLPAGELLPLLGSWIEQPQGPAGAHLTVLWRKTALQERIAEVAVNLLCEWDGSDSTVGEASGRGRVVLTLSITTFPRRRARFMPLFYLPDPARRREAVLQGVQDVKVDLVQVTAGAMGFADPGLVEAASLLEGVLSVVDDLAGVLTRRPRGVVVFRRDELTGTWVEVTQVLLGDDVIVLVANQFRDRVRSHLADVARPGWVDGDDIDGVPAGWAMFRDVEIFSRPSNDETHLDLRALVPLTSSQLKFSGGLALPGALRNRWHSWRPPEVRAISDSGELLTMQLIDLGLPEDDQDREDEIERWSDGGSGSIIVDLKDLELEDGDYAVELRSAEKVVSRRELSLRSSEHFDAALWQRAETISHYLGDPLAVLGAGAADAGGAFIQGAVVEREEPTHEVPSSTLPARPWWRAVRDQERAQTVVLKRPSSDSCFYTGKHYFKLESATVDKVGRPLVAFTMGTCDGCGLQKRFSSSYWRNKRQFEIKLAQAAATRRLDAASMPAVTGRDEISDSDKWDLALDALRYVGGGPISTLERVASQIDPGRVFIKEFMGSLEALGHIEIRRSPETLEEVAWEVCETSIVDVGDERVLTGFWCPSLISVAKNSITAPPHSITATATGSGPARWSTPATDKELLERLDLDGVAFPGRAGLCLAETLPVLSALVASLPRRRAGAHLQPQWFDPACAAWIGVVGMEGKGAYRVGRYSAQYLLRTESDLENDTVALGDVYLVKHAASSILAGRALMAYDEVTRDLAVPLGASLPGMYQRAVVLDSGWPPQRRRGFHIYRDVSPEVAGRIAFLLIN